MNKAPASRHIRAMLPRYIEHRAPPVRFVPELQDPRASFEARRRRPLTKIPRLQRPRIQNRINPRQLQYPAQ